MNVRFWMLLPCCLMAMGCLQDKPVRLENQNLGIVAIFPGEPRLHRFTQQTPFGDMEWFSNTYEPPGHLEQSYIVDVGNLPTGNRGGTTASEILATMRTFLASRLGELQVTSLPDGQGPGFHYQGKNPSSFFEGIVVVRRGRIHRAQGTASRPDAPPMKAFLDSFRVMP